MAQKYLAKVGMTKSSDPDVIDKRELHVTRDGVEEVVSISPVDAPEVDVEVEENQTVSMYLVDTDDAGHASPPGPSLDFVVTDMVPPVAPGAPSVVSLTPVP